MTAFSQAEEAFLLFIEKKGMLPYIKEGCVIGLSGGADSVLLLLLTERLANKEGFPLYALHVHHGIRGEEADRDLTFTQSLCAERGIAFFSHRANVPALAAQSGEGIEEAARRVRYAAFCDTARACGAGAVLTAHHAGDNAETVLLNLSRGTGGNGLCGIPAIRFEGNIPVLRPLLSLNREQIEGALESLGVCYVTDSTNTDTAYRRNYVRQELMPRFRSINPSFEKAMGRMCESLRADMEYLDGEAERLYQAAHKKGALEKDFLLSLHIAMRYRVLLLLYRTQFKDASVPSKVHMDAFFERLVRDGDFSLPFPGGITARVSGKNVYFSKDIQPFSHTRQAVGYGETVFTDGGKILLLEKGSLLPSSNVYNLSIHRDVSSATINGGLYIRAREDGDSYRFGGVTHKLKKLLSDAKLSREMREHLPVLCDDDGILWVPHFGVRNDGTKNGEQKNLTLYYIPPKTLS